MYEHMFASGRASCKKLVKLGEHLVGLFEDVAPGVAAQEIATAAGLTLALAVLLPGMTGLVEPVGVELDDQPVLWPAAIDVVGAGRPVRDRERSACLAQPGAEAALEPAQQDRRVAFKDGLEPLRRVVHLRDPVTNGRLMRRLGQDVKRQQRGGR